jgi:cytidylate kinase
MMNYLVTIDGPSGVGKTTLGVLLAKELRSNFFSSGKLYRIIAKFLLDNPSSDFNNIFLVIDVDLTVTLNSFSYKDSELYTKNINSKSSEIAKLKEIRKIVSDCLLILAKKSRSGLIIEGRDMGTVVFPDADLKIYLDADIEIRSQRRLKQSDNSETKADLLERDNNDKNRRESPLKIPENALYINNSNMQMDEVLNLVRENLELL